MCLPARPGTRREDRHVERLEALHKKKTELQADEKERAVHVMPVESGANDMGQITRIRTVKVTDFYECANYSHVLHIVSMWRKEKAAIIV